MNKSILSPPELFSREDGKKNDLSLYQNYQKHDGFRHAVARRKWMTLFSLAKTEWEINSRLVKTKEHV